MVLAAHSLKLDKEDVRQETEDVRSETGNRGKVTRERRHNTLRRETGDGSLTSCPGNLTLLI